MGYQGDVKRAYQLQWMKKRRDDWISKNGPCASCGSSEGLEVDHIVPRQGTERLAPAGIWSRRQEIRDAELAFCQVLCQECHKKKTALQFKITTHGTAMYRNGCRCSDCRLSQRDRQRRWRESKRAKGSEKP